MAEALDWGLQAPWVVTKEVDADSMQVVTSAEADFRSASADLSDLRKAQDQHTEETTMEERRRLLSKLVDCKQHRNTKGKDRQRASEEAEATVGAELLTLAGDALGLARGAKLSWAKQQARLSLAVEAKASSASKWQGQLPIRT